MIQQAAKAMQYIISKQIELSGSASAKDIGLVFNGDVEAVDERDQRISALEDNFNSVSDSTGSLVGMSTTAIEQLQEQVALLSQSQQLILEKLGAQMPPNGAQGSTPGPRALPPTTAAPTLRAATA